MITRLYLDNCFTHHDRTITFEKGLTGVVGPNESGKSLIVEMIRYALFGSKALRGTADDYKKLHVELDFTVQGVDYQILRKGTKIELTGGRTVSGTKAVNAAVIEILGYDMKVFDVANACNQGRVEELSEMGSAERKRMVDQTIGLNALDELIKFAGQEGNALKREAEAATASLFKPEEPEKPEVTLSVEELEAKVQETTLQVREFNHLAGFLSRAPEKPVAPKKCKVAEKVEFLREQIEKRREVQNNLNRLSRELRDLPEEEWTAGALDAAEEQHEAASKWQQKSRLLAQGHHECPKCSHQWPVADLGDLAEVEQTDPPELSLAQIREHRARLGNDEKILGLKGAIVELEQILEDHPDRSEDLAIAEAYEAQVKAYEQSLQAYEEYNQGLAEKQARYEELQGASELLTGLQEELVQARQFARDHARYLKDLEVYEQRLAEVEELAKRGEDFLKAREVIQALKVSVKTHLLPSLNKVASVLLSQMTGGERYLVEVDEDFEITIDGQSISTLSGSGKAVANLAIRIALGQILTNKVFSVFLADEVDAAMDDERAAYTADALKRLTDTVQQVIQVTHKRPETDHMVELKKA